MADEKFSLLTQIAALAGNDIIPIIDVSAGPADRGALLDQLRAYFLPHGYIWDLTMVTNGADATNDLDVQAGEALAESHDDVMVLPSTIIKRIDANWAVGTNQGGLNTGSVAANTWYEVHLIKRPDTGVVDVMFTTTANRATLPANYTKQRRIGWLRRGAAANIAFTQVGDYFTLTTQVNDLTTAPTATATAATLTAPPSSIARFRATLFCTAMTAAAFTITTFSEIVEGNITPAHNTGVASLVLGTGNATATANDFGAAGHFELRVSSSSQIEHDSALGAGLTGGEIDISTFGWIDRRRRLEAV